MKRVTSTRVFTAHDYTYYVYVSSPRCWCTDTRHQGKFSRFRTPSFFVGADTGGTTGCTCTLVFERKNVLRSAFTFALLCQTKDGAVISSFLCSSFVGLGGLTLSVSLGAPLRLHGRAIFNDLHNEVTHRWDGNRCSPRRETDMLVEGG